MTATTLDLEFNKSPVEGNDLVFGGVAGKAEPSDPYQLGKNDLMFTRPPVTSNDLVFAEPPPKLSKEELYDLGLYDILFGTPALDSNDLVFGAELSEDVEPELEYDLELTLGITFPKIEATGHLARYGYTGAVLLPTRPQAPKIEGNYDVDTFTGFARFARQSFQISDISTSSFASKFTDSELLFQKVLTPFEEAEGVKDYKVSLFSLSEVVSTAYLTTYQMAEGVQRSLSSRSQIAEIVSKSYGQPFQTAVGVSFKREVNYQQTELISGQWAQDYQKSVGESRAWQFATHLSEVMNRSFLVNFQSAEYPVNYRVPDVVVPPIDPEVPTVDPTRYNYDLVFKCVDRLEYKDTYFADLVFNDGCYDVAPPISIDFTEPYFVKNTIDLINLETGEVILATSVDFSTDISSFAWSGSLAVPFTEVGKLTSPTNKPVLVSLTFNGQSAIFLVQSITKAVTFNNKSYKVGLISPTALLDSPYSREDSATLEVDKAPQTIVEELIDSQNTGIALDWQYLSVLDWVVLAKTFSYQSMSPIKAVGELLKGSAAFMFSELGSKTLTVKKKRPYAFWETAVDPIVLPEAFTSSYSLSTVHHRKYTGVYAISGVSEVQGITAFITRADYDGAELASQIIAPALTSNQALIDAGKYALGTAGVVEKRSLSMPIIEGQPFVVPADVVEFTHEGVVSIGTVLSTSVAIKFNSQYQNFEVEVVKGFN